VAAALFLSERFVRNSTTVIKMVIEKMSGGISENFDIFLKESH
jgi:hypothetical protein